MTGAELQFSTFGTPDGCGDLLAGVLEVQERGGTRSTSAGRLLAANLECGDCQPTEFVGQFMAAMEPKGERSGAMGE